MKLMPTINAVADLVAMPDLDKISWQRTVLRGILFITCAALAFAVGDYFSVKLSVGWIFGYIWGALTVYGTMRSHLHS